MKKWKSRIAAYLSGILLLTSFSMPTMAAEITGTKTNNVNAHNYTNASRWSNPVKSYLMDNGDGTFTRVESSGTSVIIETYNNEGVLQNKKSISNELTKFGGFYSGTEYNFLVFGQNNSEEDDNKEVIRVVQYTKNWEKKGTASLCGANTVGPFDAGSLRMVQYGDMLYVRTSHKMYKSDDGLNHQSNLTFSIDIPSMEITDQFSDVMNINYGYVSHSFNQYITTDDSVLLAADHGDAYPRAVVLIKYKSEAGNQTFIKNSSCNSVNVLKIKGSVGANDTGVALGGLVVSGSSYLTAGNSVAQNDSYSASGVRNIFVTSTSKDDFSEEGTKINWITDYTDKQTNVSNPHLVKFSDDHILLLYTANSKVNYAFLDGEGNIDGEIKTMDGKLSDCVPIVIDDTALWYYTSNSTPVFCQISSDGTSKTFLATNGSDQGASGDNNQGSTGNNNQGSTGDNNQGSTGDNNQGNTGDNNQGNTGDNNQGSTGDNNQGSTGDNNQGSTGDNNQGNTDSNTQNVSLNYNSYQLQVGQTVQLTAKVTGTVATSSNANKVTWSSSNSNIASVDTNGLVKGLKAGAATITVKVNDEEATCKITVKSLVPSRGSASTRGSNSARTTKVTNNTNSQNNTNLGSLPSYVSKGTWKQNSNGTWSFTNSNGTVPKNSWGAIANPYANTSAGQAAFDWFFFDDRGNMRTGWFTDADGNVYYLNESSDGTKGRMMTGWCWVIDETGKQKCYYLNPLSDGTKGKLMVNTTIDGHTVNEKGEWVINGVVQTK